MNKRPADPRLLGALLLTGITGAMAVACNEIIGLDPGEHEKPGSSSSSTASGIGGGTGVSASAAVSTGSTTTSSTMTGGGGASSSTSTGSTSTGSTSSTGSGSTTCPAPVVACSNNDHAWAHWRPEPGPDCTDRFTKTTDTVFDKVTGLTWQRPAPTEIQTWDAAKTYCDNLGNSSGVKWRLPTRIEMVSITDYSRKPPTIIDQNAFQSTPPDIFWTSSTYAADSAYAWYVAFGGFSFNPGAINYDQKIRSHYVRCVH